jgi:hypothetical protein
MGDRSQSISLESRLATSPNLVLREEDDCALIYDPDTGAVRLLNPTAVAVWKLLDGRRTLAEVVEALRESFSDMDDNAPEQVLKLAQGLCRLGAFGTLTELEK